MFVENFNHIYFYAFPVNSNFRFDTDIVCGLVGKNENNIQYIVYVCRESTQVMTYESCTMEFGIFSLDWNFLFWHNLHSFWEAVI